MRPSKKEPRRGGVGYTPAKGHTMILSLRRQMRKRMERDYFALHGVRMSGRQWTRARKAMRRDGVEYLSLQSYYTGK